MILPVSYLSAGVIIAVFIHASHSLNCNDQSVCKKEHKHVTCEECIQIHPCCNWCSDINFNGSRCGTDEDLLSSKCQKEHIYRAGNSKIKNMTTEDFRNADEAQDKPAVQINPQNIDLRLRLNEPITFQLQYKAAMDYPLDLYYLMDLTYSMAPDLVTMVNLGSKLSETLKNLTKNYKIGFGYYSDKVAIPFAMMTDKTMDNPCASLNRNCTAGFNFVHTLNFTQSVDRFIEKLKNSNVTANLDNLEGGFDAIMQILTCHNKMRWRKFSRKILVVATGGLMHLAGDGILAGAIKKNPGICLLEKDGTYNSLVYDYPSLGEIYRKLQEVKVNILFAAKGEVFSYYSKLEQAIPEVSMIGDLGKSSSNILMLVQNSYQEVVKNVKFATTAGDHIKVSFKTSCNDPHQTRTRTDNCKDVIVGNVYTFDVTLELIKLPTNKTRDTFVIEEMNLFEDVKVNVEYIGAVCECKESGTMNCMNGAFKCGRCNCIEGWTGMNCDTECKAINACRYNNGTYMSSTCFGRGDCDVMSCKCICDSRYTGSYCEHNQCPRTSKGHICNGQFGICDKGTCVCHEDYTEKDCSCYKKTDTCTAPGQNKICSAAGRCTCGKCKCESGYSGRFCEYCAECDAICTIYEDCIVGVVGNHTNERCLDNDTEYSTVKSESVIDLCMVRFYNDQQEQCEVKFSYAFDMKKVLLQYNEPYCYKPTTAITRGLVAFAAILVFGIAVIAVIKVRNVVKDRQEWQTFETERKNFEFKREENPLYHSPVTLYKNPMLESMEMMEFDKKDN